jgi:hypothetical protein
VNKAFSRGHLALAPVFILHFINSAISFFLCDVSRRWRQNTVANLNEFTIESFAMLAAFDVLNFITSLSLVSNQIGLAIITSRTIKKRGKDYAIFKSLGIS